MGDMLVSGGEYFGLVVRVLAWNELCVGMVEVLASL